MKVCRGTLALAGLMVFLLLHPGESKAEGGQQLNMQDVFLQQKTQFPKMLEYMKFVRNCLADAGGEAALKACKAKAEKKAAEIGFDMDDGGEGDDDITWSPRKKEQTLMELDQAIAGVEKAMPCISKAQNMMEMATCMQE